VLGEDAQGNPCGDGKIVISYKRMNESPFDTKARLTSTATRLFAAAGYRGTSVRDITAAAQVNLGAISYHFGSKAGLYEQTILGVQEGLLARLRAAVHETKGDALDRILALAEAHFRHLSDHPDQRSLMMQALLFERNLPPSAMQFLPQVARLVAGLIAEGQAHGIIRPGDPRLLTIAVMAQPVLLNVFRPILRAGPGIDLDDETTRDLALRNALDFIRAGLQAPREAAAT